MVFDSCHYKIYQLEYLHTNKLFPHQLFGNPEIEFTWEKQDKYLFPFISF